jgi:hypothetical protein
MWVLALSILGCNTGAASCEAYVEAYNSCAESYQGTSITSDLLGCDDASADYADYYDCLTDAYEAADCTTDDGWQTASEDGAICETPTE